VSNVSAGTELTPRGIGFPVLLWFLAIVFLALAAIRWTQRARYVRATTPEERAAARVAKPVDAHRPGDELDYGTSIEDAPK
jgi:ribose/xylose/arabinose/galactoside ABC-type transport system permease subunit